MSSEETPLLDCSSTCSIQDEHDKVYDRFSPTQKRTIVSVVSWAAIIPLFVSSSFIPSVPEIAREFGSTGAIINLAVSLSLTSVSVSSLVWATYSGHYGRRPVYLASLPCLCIGSLGVALARSVPSLMLWRVIQAFGTSSIMSVGAAVLGDIYKVEERGTAMGLFFGASLLGAALAPLVGGLATHYTSWRDMQYALFVTGLIAIALMFRYLPETSHPGTRGVDKLASASECSSKRVGWVWLNPFSSMALLRSPNILAMTLISASGLLTDYVLLIPLSYTVGVRYHITNEALIGALFMASGVGNILGSLLAGPISDRNVVKWRAHRAGEWVPEDRLRATLWPAATLVPLSVLFSGLTTRFIDGKLGIALNLACLFMNGIGADLALSPVSAYLVDLVHDRSAELIAVHDAIRNLLVALATTVFLPLIASIGVAGTDAIVTLIAYAGFGLLWTVIRYGGRMRAMVDVGYSTASTN
ncbi:MFS general substrate transporter [Laetiporus sulphureus 93-53]|uniref:MFS general substrate transporter n=1 Tax=Laetiporus sulphureus 93-53 TaxID=1314785 RepID=A0A165FU74_9APHY|nr:MFS general substrate transporter [Laetiporus sulphureus 93-53]KZT09415.1 MFS general substrate transporter [Laetiporus sulphureus 93-53]